MKSATVAPLSSADDCSMQRHSQSFAWATKLLSPKSREPIYALYRLCRSIDELADSNTRDVESRAKAREALLVLKQAVLGQDHSDQNLHSSHAAMNRSHLSPTQREAVARLIIGVSGDLTSVRIASVPALLSYCFSVAGTVGLLVLPALGVTDSRARAPAAALGMAMQLSNIARDVVEDAANDRIYLPASALPAELSAQAIAGKSPDALAACVPAIRQILQLAEQFYQIAERGFCYIPLRNRFAVRAASMIYREIGREVSSRLGDHGFAQRVVISQAKKLRLTAYSALAMLNPFAARDSFDTDIVQRAIQPWIDNVLETKLPWRCT